MSEQERIDLQKMTKDKIIQHFEHLDSAVETKDKDINNLKEKHAEEIRVLKEQHALEIAKARSGQTREALKIEVRKELELEYLPLRKELEEEKKKHENVDNRIALLEQTIAVRTQQLNEAIGIHGDFLKQISGAINNEIRLNEYYVKKVTE